MKRSVFLVCALLIAASIAACEPATPAPKNGTTTPTSQPNAQTTSQPNVQMTSQPSGQPTVNARATEAVIISHIFATMTAGAPTAAPSDATPARKATTAPSKPQVTKSTPPPPGGQATPKETADPYLAQIPKGMGGILIANYIGNRDAIFTIADKSNTIKANSKALIVIAPGRYNFSLSVPGVPEANRSETVDVAADAYTTYSLTLPN